MSGRPFDCTLCPSLCRSRLACPLVPRGDRERASSSPTSDPVYSPTKPPPSPLPACSTTTAQAHECREVLALLLMQPGISMDEETASSDKAHDSQLGWPRLCLTSLCPWPPLALTSPPPPTSPAAGTAARLPQARRRLPRPEQRCARQHRDRLGACPQMTLAPRGLLKVKAVNVYSKSLKAPVARGL